MDRHIQFAGQVKILHQPVAMVRQKLSYSHFFIFYFFFVKSNICSQLFTEPVLFTESKDPLGAGFVANNTNAESDSNHNSSPNQVLPMSAQHSNTLSNTLSSHYR